jgi:hypothetical protein
MSEGLRWFILALGVGRVLLGLVPFVAASPSSRLLGFPAAHDSPTTRLMARLFGVRDSGLGVLAFWSLRHPETLPFAILFNAAMDSGDIFSAAIPLVRREGINRGAATSAAFAAMGCGGWVLAWVLLP